MNFSKNVGYHQKSSKKKNTIPKSRTEGFPVPCDFLAYIHFHMKTDTNLFTFQ